MRAPTFDDGWSFACGQPPLALAANGLLTRSPYHACITLFNADR